MPQDALFSEPKAPLGRNERAVRGLARHLKTLEQVDPWKESLLALASSQARAVDILENNPRGSRYALGPIGRVLLDVLNELRPEVGDSDGDVDAFIANVRAAMGDTETAGPPD